MTTKQIREKYLTFFEKKGHKIIPPAPLVLQNDPTTLFTSSGMQPLVPYLLGQPHPEGQRIVDSQPSIRVQDIEEVGDNRHTTFFEMLGNWSLGDYFKKEQLEWIWEFLTKELQLPQEKLYVSIFEGNESVPRDEESYMIWKSLGVSEDHIFEYGVKKNWWSRSGIPEQMPEGEIGGPDSEIFFDFGEGLKLHESSAWKNEPCHPNCDCGRFMEIGNSVFIQYKKQNGKLVELPQKNVDFGGGLERLVAAVKNDPDVFKIDVFAKVISEIEKSVGKSYIDSPHNFRIIADHVRGAVFLAAGGTIPSNKLQGYVMRRLIRRALVKARQLKEGNIDPDIFPQLVVGIVDSYQEVYFEKSQKQSLQNVIWDEVMRFAKTLDRGLREFNKLEKVDGKLAFDLFQTYGSPLEITLELAMERGHIVDVEEFKKAFADHQDKSRTQSSGVFKGGLADHSAEVTRLHTVTHLIHSSLRKVLGETVSQKGSNITKERLRFDFVHDQKLTPEQIKKIEDLVNSQIDSNLPVSFEVMTLEEAKKAGALAFFGEKYADHVKVYTIGGPGAEYFSKEVCGGPHIASLSEIGGRVTIFKEQSLGAGIRRIYAKII